MPAIPIPWSARRRAGRRRRRRSTGSTCRSTRRRPPDRRASPGRPRASWSTRSRTGCSRGSTSTSLDVAATRRRRTLIRETSGFWINSEDTTTPAWLKDGSFLWLSGAVRLHAPLSLRRRRHAAEARSRPAGGSCGRSTAWTRPAAGSTSPAPSAVRSAATSIASGSMAPGWSACRRPAGHARRRVQPGASATTRHVERRLDAAAGAPAPRRRPRGPRDRREPGRRRSAGYRLSTPEFLQVKTRDGFAMEAMMIKPPDFDPSAPLSRLPVHLWRAAHAAGAERLDAADTCITSCWRSTASSSGSATTARRAARGSSRRLAGLSALRRDRAARHRRRPRLAEAAAVRRRIAHRHPRLELRRLHDQLRAHPQHELRRWASPAARCRTGATTTRSTRSAIMGLPKDNPDGYRDSSPRSRPPICTARCS